MSILPCNHNDPVAKTLVEESSQIWWKAWYYIHLKIWRKRYFFFLIPIFETMKRAKKFGVNMFYQSSFISAGERSGVGDGGRLSILL